MSKILVGDHWAYFGDGNAAQILDSREYIKTDTGIKKIKFILLPSKRIEQMYEIEEEQDPNGVIVKEYPATDVIFLERGTSRTRCWILTDFNGGQTPASRRDQDLAEALRDTERLLRSAVAAKNRAYQELEVERQQQKQALRLKADLVKEVAKARGRVDDDGDMGMMDPGQG